MLVEFYEMWAAFPHARDRDNEINIGVYPNGKDDGGNYEFSLVEVGTGPKHRARIALRVCLFSDSWQAFADLPELFSALREYGDMSVAQARVMLADLGYIDKTSRYEDQHSHHFRCECGARPEGVTA